MKRGQLIADKLAALIVEKMEKRAHHGAWEKSHPLELYNLMRGEIAELSLEMTDYEYAHESKRTKDMISNVIGELVDVAAYCAIIIDVLEKG